MTPKIIAISGVSGAGKTTLSQALVKKYGAISVAWDDFDDVSNGPSDYVEWYYRSRDYREWNYQALANTLNELKIKNPLIIFDSPLGKCHAQTGIFIDKMVHIEIPLDISLGRRLLRDYSSNKHTKDELLDDIEYYLTTSRPLFIDDDLKKTADIVVDGMLPISDLVQIITWYLISSILNDLSHRINELYGYVEIAGDNFGEPAINSGPCGAFAYAFFKIWNQYFTYKVAIVFVMLKGSHASDCWHVLIKLPNGALYDGGVGTHDKEVYPEEKYELQEMNVENFNLEILDQRSYGLEREYPRYCPHFSIKEVSELIEDYLKQLRPFYSS